MIKKIKKGLEQLVSIGILDQKKGKFRFNKKYKQILMSCKPSKCKEEMIIEALWKAGYFKTPKTTEEVTMVINLLLLKKRRLKNNEKRST